jgi:hypothetical protein
MASEQEGLSFCCLAQFSIATRVLDGRPAFNSSSGAAFVPAPGATAVLVYKLDRLGESGDLRNFSAGGNFAK